MADSLRIAMVAACPFPAPRGTPIRIQRLAESLADRGHDVHVIAYHLGEPCPARRFTLHRIREVRTYRRWSPGPSWQKLLVVDPLLAATAARVLRTHAFDIIHAHHAEGFLVGLLARGRGRTPIVLDAHTILEAELPYYRLGIGRRPLARIGRALDRWLPRHAAHVIAAHDDIRRRLCAADPRLADRISVATNGVELEHFEVGAPANGPAAPPTLVYTGNLAEYQGIELMLRAFGELRSRRSDVRLRIVSDASFEPYDALATALGLRGGIDVVASDFADLPRHLAGAAVALNPRIACDGIPQKLLNYMAAGRPIVSFRGGAKHLAHGELGLVVADGDVEGFAAAIARLLDDPALAGRLGANAQAYARATLSWGRAAEQVEAVYRRIAPPCR